MKERRNRREGPLESERMFSDREVDDLLDEAKRVREELRVPAPSAARERAFFTQAVASRSPAALPLRFLVPAALLVAAIAALAGFGRTALPGQTLYPVREALASMGLAATTEEEVQRRIDDAREQLKAARGLQLASPASAWTRVMGAIGDLERARTLAEKLSEDARTGRLATITKLEKRASGMIAAMNERAEQGDESEGDDSSGPGGGDDGGDDDNSGPGGGDDDNSGPGGGDDDSGDDDSSGPGGGDDGGDDDNSGPGGGDDDGSGDDSSGSGSGDDDSSGSGSGDDDSSGSGSGDDDSSGSGSGGDDSDDD